MFWQLYFKFAFNIYLYFNSYLICKICAMHIFIEMHNSCPLKWKKSLLHLRLGGIFISSLEEKKNLQIIILMHFTLVLYIVNKIIDESVIFSVFMQCMHMKHVKALLKVQRKKMIKLIIESWNNDWRRMFTSFSLEKIKMLAKMCYHTLNKNISMYKII